MAWQLIDTAPKDGTVFLGWREVPTYDEDLRKTVITREPCIAQVVFGSLSSIPFYARPGGERITHWQPISPPEVPK
jgi:hypothetical protein